MIDQRLIHSYTNFFRKFAGSASVIFNLHATWSTWCDSDQLSEVLILNRSKSFLIARSSVRMLCTLFCKIPNALSIFLSNLPVSYNNINDLQSISGVVTVSGLSGRRKPRGSVCHA